MSFEDLRLEYNALSWISQKLGDQEMSDVYLEGAKRCEDILFEESLEPARGYSSGMFHYLNLLLGDRRHP